jgi:hypothetical protein
MVLVVPVPRPAAGSSSLIQANSKLQRLGAWRIDVSPTLGGATGAFGRPTSCHGISLEDGSVVRWRGLGVKVLTATLGVIPQDKSSCTFDEMPVSVVTVTGRMWQTSLGLRIGDTARRLRVLYPRASFHAASRGEASPARSYWLVTRRADCLGDCTTRRITAPQLVAHTHAGRVVALIFPVGAQGE